MSDFNYQEYLRNNPLLKEKVKDQLITESQEVNEGNLDDLRKLKDNLDNALTAFKKKAEDLKLGVSFGDATQTVNKYIDDVFKADMKRSGGKIDESEENVEEAEIELSKDEMDKLHSDGEVEKGKDKISYKMKVSELKAKIKEDIISLLQEEEEDEVDVEDEIEDEVEVDVEEPSMDTADAGLSQDEQEIQDSLKLAYDNAVAIGDQKLADQIGNSITFFTRTHVVER